MLRSIVGTSLRERSLVVVLAGGLVIYGVWGASHAKLDVLPEFAPPQVVIQTEAPGFAPEQVEQRVTLPIESAVSGVAGLEALRSESIQGLSVVTVVFPKSKASDGPKEAPKPEELQQAMAMMKGMMAGLKMKTLLQVNGAVVKTNSPYAAGSDVTLMEVDFDQLDEAGLKNLAASGKDMPSPAELKGVKGLKINDGEVSVEFK